ncbi:MAG: lysozyme inhibitor LprI family protein [Chitinophagales bacterium]
MRHILIFAIILASHTLYSQTGPQPIDAALEACLEIADNQTTQGMIECVRTAEKAWDAEMNVAYRNLLSVLTPEEADLLRSAQKAWLSYRDKEMPFAGTIYTNLGGTMWLVEAAFRNYEIVRSRCMELQSYYTIVAENKVLEEE